MAFVSIASVFLILLGCDINPEKNQNNNEIKSEWHFAIVPHFMLNSEKVDQFYQFLIEKYYTEFMPNKIILFSPNHFHSEILQEQTICKSDNVYYKLHSAFLSSDLINYGVKCDDNENIFSSRGNIVQTDEHGIGEHFQRINKYFSGIAIMPIIMPSFKLEIVKDLQTKLQNLTGNILVIASVDFTHYLPEDITLQHDEKSIEILTRDTINQSDFSTDVDADCTSCLYLLSSLANQQGQKGNLRLRDSSSTIMQQDMKEENTSRIFMRYN